MKNNNFLAALETLKQQLQLCCSTAASNPAVITISFKRANEEPTVIELFDEAELTQQLLAAVDETLANLS